MRKPIQAVLVASGLVFGWACGNQSATPGASGGAVSQSVSAHAGVQLIESYVSGDTTGRRLRRDPWFLNASAWEDEPAWDRYVVISGLTTERLSADSSTARVRVKYKRLGYINHTAADSSGFESNAADEGTVFTAVLMDNGWRIAAPQQPPHVAVGAVLRGDRLTAAARSALQRLSETR